MATQNEEGDGILKPVAIALCSGSEIQEGSLKQTYSQHLQCKLLESHLKKIRRKIKQKVLKAH